MPDFMTSSRGWPKRLFIVENRSGGRQGLGAGARDMDFIVSKDLGASFAMEMLHRPWLTRFMHFVTALGNNEELRVVTVLATLFFCFIGRWRTGVCLVA